MPDWILEILIYSIIIPILLWIGSIVRKLVEAKVTSIIMSSKLKEKEAARDMFYSVMRELSDAVSTSIRETQETYVAQIRKQGDFTPEQQREAFQLSFNRVKDIMSAEALELIEKNTNALDKIITAEIEAQLPRIKKRSPVLFDASEV